MSQLGYISQSYGKEFKISVANTYSYNILSSNNLPENMLIIASNIDEDGNDTGTYSLIATDYLGTPVRLTYTIQEGNGLKYSSTTDSLSLNIDNDTIIEENGKLKFNIKNHLSNSFSIEDNNIYINKDIFPNPNYDTFGIAKVDNNTIKIDDSKIYVDTSNLQYSNNSTGQYGIVIGDGKGITIDNGNIYLNTSYFTRATENNYGFIKGDGNTISINNGVLSVVTKNLSLATPSKYGISKPDMKTVIFDKNGNITVNEENLSISSNTNYGVAKIDDKSININNGTISVKTFTNLKQDLINYNTLLKSYKDKIQEIENYLGSGTVLEKNKGIQLFSINNTSVVELVKPKFEEEVVNMEEQIVSAEFDIITTCDFILNIQFEEGTNEFPNVDLKEVHYFEGGSQDIPIVYDKETALSPSTVYESTQGKLKRLNVKFAAKNFRSSTSRESLITSVNFIVLSKENNSIQKNEKFSIIRYNSLYKEDNKNIETTNNTEAIEYIVTDIHWSLVN